MNGRRSQILRANRILCKYRIEYRIERNSSMFETRYEHCKACFIIQHYTSLILIHKRDVHTFPVNRNLSKWFLTSSQKFPQINIHAIIFQTLETWNWIHQRNILLYLFIRKIRWITHSITQFTHNFFEFKMTVLIEFVGQS